jgi:methylated-DNA-protein-cysteine methyltransferase related protein
VLLPRDELHRTVARVVRAIPRGRVLSYSRVAVLAGLPGRARLIGKVMAMIGSQLPWWRVLRADRTMAEEVRVEQAKRLRREGVKVQDSGRVPRSAFLPIGDARLQRRIHAGNGRRSGRLRGGEHAD